MPHLCSEPLCVGSSPLRAAGALDFVNLPDADALHIANLVQVVPKHSTCCYLAPKGSRLLFLVAMSVDETLHESECI